MGSGRARKRRNLALEAQYEKRHGGRRAQFAVGGTSAPTPKREGRAEDGLSRDMRKMLKMKRMLEERRGRKKMARGDGVGEVAGREAASASASAPVATADAIPAATTAAATTTTAILTSQQKVHQREEEQPRPKRPRNKYAHLVEREGAEARPLSKSKQRKKEFMRNKRKGKGKGKGKDRDGGGGGDGDRERDASSDEEAGGNVDRVAFGEQADAPMKEVLRSKHWAEKPKREGVDPAVSIVGLGAAMGARRVAGMGSRALAALYRDQKRSKMGAGEGGEGGEGQARATRATRESLKQLVRHGNGQ